MLAPIIAAAIIAFSGLFLRGFVGFGSSLVMTPLLMLFLDIQTAVIATAIVQVAVGTWVATPARQIFNWTYLRLLLPTSVLGIILGSSALVNFDGDLLKRIFGIVTVLFALRIIASLRNSKKGPEWPQSAGHFAGILAGIMGGIFGTSGPPIVIFLEKQLHDREVLWATLLAYFVVIDSLRLANYVFYGLLTWEVAEISLVMLPAAVFGAYLGSKLHAESSERLFRFGIGIVLLISGFMLAMSN